MAVLLQVIACLPKAYVAGVMLLLIDAAHQRGWASYIMHLFTM
jgi:hypothetical protein